MLKINEKWKNKNGKYICPSCGKIYTKMGICTHIWRSHTKKGKLFDPFYGIKRSGQLLIPWNKGLTSNTSESVKKGAEKLKEGYRLGKIIPPFLGKKHTKKSLKKLSESMKKAHKEGRAWNIGKSRWNNKPSYPESFFMKVIKNDFDDKNYKYEMPFKIYSLDFAWPHKKKVIEIDGEQHKRFEEYKKRDRRKDYYLKKDGWKIKRISWKRMCKNTKKIINELNLFIGKI